MFEIQSLKTTRFGETDLSIEHICKSQMGKDQVSRLQRNKRSLLACNIPCKYFIESPWNLVKTSNSVNSYRPSSVTRSLVTVVSDQWRVSLHMVMLQNVMYHSGEGVFILFDKIPVSTIELP